MPSPALDALRARLKDTLGSLSESHLEKFKFYLRKSEGPQIDAQELKEASTPATVTSLVLRHYRAEQVPAVLISVLEKMPRMDLIPEWENTRRKTLKRPFESDSPELERYNMDQLRKAFVMCVHKGRPGSTVDKSRIINWLEKCKFEYKTCTDPDEQTLMKNLREFRDEINEIKDEISCCLITLMAHGGEGTIKTVQGEEVNLSIIFEMFNNENCPALQNKPKIFIIQACRGAKKDNGVQTDDEPMELDKMETKRLPTSSDYYIVYSTQKDHVALRDPVWGSVMIQEIDQVFRQHGMKWHIGDFFTQVNSRMVQKTYCMENKPVKVVLVMESTLTKAIYF